MINYTPLLNSFPLKAAFKVNKVSIKLDNCLPTGSFKDRAMIALCKDLKAKGATKLIGSSGGNAGVACSYAASATGLSATIFVPDSTRPMMINRMKEYGANVVPGGETWSEADQAARAAVAVDPTAEYAPPFDHPSIWVGNSTVVDEIYEQRNGVAPDVIICSVGGGGLLGGILLGLDRKGGAWKKCKVVAVETLGSASFFDSWKEGKVVTLNKIDTIAHSLGAKRVAEGVFNMAKKHPGGVFPIVVSDREAIDAVTFFLNEHRILVEAACGVSVAAGLKLGELLNLTENEVVNLDVVVEICGGSCMNSELLENYQKTARSSL